MREMKWCKVAYTYAFLDSDNTQHHEYADGVCIWCNKKVKA